jgi:hypothetical protein
MRKVIPDCYASDITIQNSDGTEKIVLRNKHIWPGTKCWKPLGDGITRCWYCGKLLTDEVSFARGVGPCCIKKYGPMQGRAWLEEHVKLYKKFVRKQEKLGVKVIDRMYEWLRATGVKLPTFEEAV